MTETLKDFNVYWSWCPGAKKRICSFCQYNVMPPNDGIKLKEMPVPLATEDHCPKFYLRPDVSDTGLDTDIANKLYIKDFIQNKKWKENA